MKIKSEDLNAMRFVISSFDDMAAEEAVVKTAVVKLESGTEITVTRAGNSMDYVIEVPE